MTNGKVVKSKVLLHRTRKLSKKQKVTLVCFKYAGKSDKKGYRC